MTRLFIYKELYNEENDKELSRGQQIQKDVVAGKV